MKIEFKERGRKEYYEEMLYISYYFSKASKNPQKKVYLFTSYMWIHSLYMAVLLLVSLFFYFWMREVSFIFLTGAVFILLIAELYLIYQGKERMKRFLSTNDTKIIELTKEGIDFEDVQRNYRISWNEIRYILINRYSITFLPKSNDNLLISIDKQYQESVLEAIRECEKEDLIIDNSSLYKS